MVRLLLNSLLILSMMGAPAFAQETKEPHWWEVITGIIAIPTGILSIVTAYLLIKQTILASKKMEIELRESQQKLGSLQPTQDSSATLGPIIDPITNYSKGIYLILGFVILYLLIQFWAVIEGVLGGVVFTGAGVGFQIAGHSNLFDNPILIFLFGVQQLLEMGWIAIIVLFGWPLFQDISKLINLRLRFRFWASSEKASHSSQWARGPGILSSADCRLSFF